MNRKSIIICIAAVTGLALVAVVLISLLYKGVPDAETEPAFERKGSEMLAAVATDAVAVVQCENLGTAASLYASKDYAGWAPLASAATPSFIAFTEGISSLIEDGSLDILSGGSAVVSFFYTGDLLPVLAVEAGSSSEGLDSEMARLQSLADSQHLTMKWLGSDRLASLTTPLKGKSIIIVSPSETLVKAAENHILCGASVCEAKGFNEAASEQPGRNRLFICNGNSGKIFSTVADHSVYGKAEFFKTLGTWSVFSLEANGMERCSLSGMVTTSRGQQDFMNVFKSSGAGSSTVMDILPQYCSYLATIPTSDISLYAEAYRKYADSRVGLSRFVANQKSLQARAGAAPGDWIREKGISEAAVAAFEVAGKMEQFILLKTDSPADDSVSEFSYGGFTASVLGGMFAIPDESYCARRGQWLIIGSEAGVKMYSTPDFPSAPLSASSMAKSHAKVLAAKNNAFLLWVPLSDNGALLGRIFSKNFASTLALSSTGINESLLAAVPVEKGRTSVSLDLVRTAVSGEDVVAPVSISVSDGPFTVKNSGTGKMDKFALQGGRLVLSEDDVPLWSVPFAGSLCGRAANVDFYANGKLQILFVSGRRLYMLDRLGNMVEGFPVELGKQVLLGPDVYDFNNARRYNIMVLNTDNTIDMYNLKGEKPASWQGITAVDKILGLPDYFTRGPKSYWAAHTASQTLVFSFYGGQPVKVLQGNVAPSDINFD